jgi:hypothetical protein
MIVVIARLRTALPKPGPGVGKRTTPKAAATLKLIATTTAGPTTAISSPRPSARVESNSRPNRTSLTTWNNESDGEGDRGHRHRDTDQRCNVG